MLHVVEIGFESDLLFARYKMAFFFYDNEIESLLSLQQREMDENE